MLASSWLPLLSNAALLLTAALAFDLVSGRGGVARGGGRPWLAGLVLGAIGVAILWTPYELAPGLVFDLRSVLLSVAGYVFGPVPTLVATAAMAAARLAMGGIGAASGTAVIVLAAAVGLAWRAYRPLDPTRPRPRTIVALVLVATLAELVVSVAAQPPALGATIVRTVALPMLVLNPLTGWVLARLLLRRVAADRTLSALALSEALLAESQRVARVGSWSMTLEDQRFTLSAEAYRLLGVDPASFRPDEGALAALLPPAEADDVRAWMAGIAAGEAPGERLLHVRPDGAPVRVLSLRGTVVDDPDGRPRRFVGTLQDVTDRLATEERVRWLSTAVEQSPVTVLMTDLDARIVYVNQAFVDSTGYARDEALGRNANLLRSPFTPPAVYTELWQALTAGRPWRGEFVNQRKDGRVYEVAAVIAPVADDTGQVRHYLAIKEDIGERKRVARELEAHRERLEELVDARTAELAEARARAEAANAAKTVFLANMSHEIRTPLNAIVGLNHLLATDAPTARQRQRLAKVDEAAQHLLTIVNDVLDLAKIEAGKMTLEVGDFPLASVLDHVRSMVADGARSKGLELVAEVDGVPEWLHGDPVRLRQALLNLAGNAVKFTDQGRVRLGVRLLGRDGERLRVRFEVADTGIGIPRERLPKLFQAFEQVDPSSTRAHGGTGLGLAITRRIAELMGGEVGIESEPRRGTRVWFDVDLGAGQPRPIGPVAVEGARARVRRFANAQVLLAEDHAINRDVALDLLRAVGLQAEAAADGREAVQRCRERRYDLVLMDLQMPVMDGLQATRALRRLPGYAAVPVIAMTANVYAEDRESCLRAGMDDFVPKPIDPEQFYATLARWLPDADDAVGDAPPAPRPEADAAAADGALETLARTWPEGDVARGLAAVGGDEARLVALLRRLAEGHRDDPRRIGDALDDGDLDAARQRAHALKGAAGTLGADALHDAAATIERQLAAGHLPNLRGLAAALRALDDALEALPATEPPEPTSFTNASTHASLARLVELLERDDAGAPEAFEAHRAALTAADPRRADALGAQLAAFDLPAALDTARAWLRALDGSDATDRLDPVDADDGPDAGAATDAGTSGG